MLEIQKPQTYSQIPQKRLIRLKATMDLTGLSRSSIYRGMEDRSFPRSVRIGLRAVAWNEEDVQMWIEERIVEASGTEAA